MLHVFSVASLSTFGVVVLACPSFSFFTLVKSIFKLSILHSTYSPLALYFLLDNNLLSNRAEINGYFDILINETELDKEIKNLIIYKKGLFNANFETENNLIKILNPIINSESVWKSHALYLLAEYFFDKNQKQKAKEFYEKIITLKNTNSDINKEVQKRLNRDFSE